MRSWLTNLLYKLDAALATTTTVPFRFDPDPSEIVERKGNAGSGKHPN